MPLIDADMFTSKDCFTKGDMLKGIDYVFHTAAPLLVGGNKVENEEKSRMYVEATQALMETAIKEGVKKVVIVGAASSIVGQ